MAREDQATHFLEIEKHIGFAQTILADGVLYVSGLIAVNESLQVVGPGDMALQIQTVYTGLQKVLAHHGLTLTHVVKELVFATDLEALKSALPVRRACFEAAGAYFPASTMVEVRRLFLDQAMIEVEVIAHLPQLS